MVGRLSTPRGERGFALVLAILALLLLTFLGLTLAATTSVELQIATNYRWSQQALFNAEAGLEVGRTLLSNIGDASVVLPPARSGVTWDPATVSPTRRPPSDAPYARNDAEGVGSRNFENGDCDEWGNGTGYGAVLDDGVTAGAPFQNVSTIFGSTLNGTFTLWVRRKVAFEGGANTDDPSAETLIVTAEGTAPYRTAASAFAQERRAVRIVEAEVSLTPGCVPGKAQSRQSGFADCTPLAPAGAPAP